jgi:hypothetical protein
MVAKQLSFFVVVVVGVYVPPTQYRSYGDFPALLVAKISDALPCIISGQTGT